MLEQPCGDMLPLGDKCALAPFEDRELLFHVGVKFVLPLGELRPVAEDFLCRQPSVLCDRREAQVQMGRFLVHVYHGGEDVALADLPLHKGNRLAEKGFDLRFFPALEELRAGGDKGVHKHGAVLACLAARRLDTGVYLLPVTLSRLNNVKIILAAGGVNIRVAGVLLLCALMVRFQCPGWPRFVFGKP